MGWISFEISSVDLSSRLFSFVEFDLTCICKIKPAYSVEYV